MNTTTGIQVQVSYRNASGKVHTSGGYFEDTSGLKLFLDFLGIENLVSIEFTN
jgi:hypothetical protein